MNRYSRKLADLHTHLYGCIHSADFLEFLKDREVDWARYESNYHRVYGVSPCITHILDRCRRGIADAGAEFDRLFVFGDDDAGNFDRFQAKYNMLNHGGVMSGFWRGELPASVVIDETCMFIHKIIARQHRQNLGYVEHRMTLGPDGAQAQSREMLLAMLRTYAAYEDADIQARLAISLPREDPWPNWELVREAALGPLGHLLTGVDFCYLEEGYPPKDQRQFFDAVSDFNLRHPERALAILYHVGESFNDKSLESAVRWVHEAAELGAHRLGHAIALGVDPERYGRHTRTESVAERMDQLRYDLRHREGLADFGVHVDVGIATEELERLGDLPIDHRVTMEYDDAKLAELRRRQEFAIGCVRELGAVIEVCPTSNRRIGGITNPEHHPVKQFIASNAPFVVASDDPGIFGITLADEVAWVGEHHRVPDDMMEHIVDMAWSSRSEVLTGRLTGARAN